MRKAPPIVVHISDEWPSTKLAERICAFNKDCIERRLESMDLTIKQKIAVIDHIIRILLTKGNTTHDI